MLIKKPQYRQELIFLVRHTVPSKKTHRHSHKSQTETQIFPNPTLTFRSCSHFLSASFDEHHATRQWFIAEENILAMPLLRKPCTTNGRNITNNFVYWFQDWPHTILKIGKNTSSRCCSRHRWILMNRAHFTKHRLLRLTEQSRRAVLCMSICRVKLQVLSWVLTLNTSLAAATSHAAIKTG